ncbi:MAG: hypothetical protein IJL35_13245 [Bacteroidaceae bacterium]|nr:hypothetical protein [Bacteroidaceae bacterium]
MEDKKYAIELEVVTPLSVGAGNDNDWMRGIDFVQKDGKVYILDIKKAVEQGVDIDKLTSLFENSDEKGISQLLGNKLESVSKQIFQSPVTTTNAIKSFLRTQFYDKPVVAGSSIKGSVRSALFHHLRENERNNEEVFGNMNDGTDLMRFVRIADIEMPRTILVNTKIFNLQKDGSQWTGGWKHAMSETNSSYRPNGFNTLYECVAPGQKGLGSIAMAGKAFDILAENTDKFISHKAKKEQLMKGNIHDLFQIINQVTKGYLQKEKAFFEKYSAERSEELTDNVNALLDMIPEDNSYCLLKMSVGVGFHSITGDWQYEDYDQTGIWTENRNAGKKKYKSRKTAEYKGHLQLMGFVKLRALNAEELSKREEILNAEHAEIIESIVAPARQREAEKLKQQEEELKRKIAHEEELKKQKACQELLEKIKLLYANNQLEEAISKAKEALAFDPDNADFKTWFEKCKKAKEIEDYRKSEEAATAQKFSQPLAEVIKGKNSAGNLVGTTMKWVKTEGNSFGQTECDAFIAAVQQLPSKEMKKLNSKLSDLAKVVNKEWIETIRNNG